VTVDGTGNSNELKLLQLAASVERNSEHPLAEAVVHAKSQQLTDARDFEAVAGSGVQGYISEQLVQIGTQTLDERIGIDTQARACTGTN